MDLEIHQSLFLDHIKSQWLTLLPALETILAQLPAAEKYFFDFLPHKKEYENENTLKIQICFVTFICPPFTDFFDDFQQAGPLVHFLLKYLKVMLGNI